MLADLHSLFLAAVASNSALALTLIAIARSRGMRSVRHWGYAQSLHAVGYILFALRGQIPDLISIGFANALESMFVAMWTVAIASFLHRRLHPAQVWGPVLLTALVFSYFLHDYRARVLLGTPIFVLQLLYTVYLLASAERKRRGVGTRLLGLSLAATALLFVVRIGAALAGVEPLVSFTTQ